MAGRRNRNAVAAWRCEDAKGERWSAKFYRELLELGKPATCKQNMCSKMRERLDRHRLSCPASILEEEIKPLTTRPQVKRTVDQASTTTRKSSVGISTRRGNIVKRKSKNLTAQASTQKYLISPFNSLSEVQSAQTNLTFFGNVSPKQNEETIMAENYISNGIASSKPTGERISLKEKEVNNDISLRSDGYSGKLNRVIHEFFLDIPVFPNTSEIVKQKRFKIIDEFAYNIADLYIFVNDINYCDKVEHEIDECLRVLPMWEPQSRQHRNDYINCLKDTLLALIKTFNDKWHVFYKWNFENNSRSYLSRIQNKRNEKIENVIIHWVDNNLKTASKRDIVTSKIIKKIKPFLLTATNDKPIIKTEIVNILQELSTYLQWPQDIDLYVHTLASDLTNLLGSSDYKCNFNDEPRIKKKSTFNDDELISNTEHDVISRISDILFGYDDIALHDNTSNVVKEISRILKTSCEFSDSEASSLANHLMTNVRDCLSEDEYPKKDVHKHSSSFLVLTSEQDLSKNPPPFHSTPTNYVKKKEISTLNEAEKLFVEKVSEIIRTWLDTTDKSFETMKEQIYKETVVDDITNDVHTNVKEIIQFKKHDSSKVTELFGGFLNKIILKGILKHDLFTRPMTDESPQVVQLKQHILALFDSEEFVNKSALIEPQHGNRQAMANVKFKHTEDWNPERELFYQPKAIDILEDNISVWLNEQPSDIYEPCDKPTRNKLMREIAISIQDKMVNKKPDSEIKNEIKQWLNKIVKPEMQTNVDHLAENLRDKIVKLPQDETLTRKHQKRIDMNEAPVHYNESAQISFRDTEADKQVHDYIEKYIRQYNLDDNVVNGVLKLMLKRELYKLSPVTREELYNNSTYDVFNTAEFNKELEISKVIHDWLKNIPFYYSLLKPGYEINEFIHTLSRNITDTEMERIKHPDRMDYNSWLYTEIATYMMEKCDQITNDEDKRSLGSHVEQLCMHIMNLRKDDQNSDPLTKMIAEHMHKYDAELRNDYVKKVLWRRRLGENIMKLFPRTPVASRADVQKALTMIPVPHDDSVIKYKMEVKYNITIHDWFHALPLAPLQNTDEENKRKNKMKELLQKVMDTYERKAENPHDKHADNELDKYVATWISELKFEEDAKINIPVLISQLRSGLEYVKWSEKQPQRSPEQGNVRCSRPPSKSLDPKLKDKDPGEQMVETIENWCNDLPIKEGNNEATKSKKKQIATNIFEIVGSLDDSRIGDDSEKVKNILSNGIEEQLQNLTNHKGVSKNKENLKDELVDKIMHIKTMIHDRTAGDDYVHALETSIDASLPNAFHRSPKYDPSYELFKKRLVMLWLLENYDYAIDFHSLKYKKMLSEDVRSLIKEVQKRNVFATDEDEMMNDINSALYKARPPNEDAIVDEIENIKLRCEIEVWSNELPLKESSNFSKMLERDQILTILSKILFDIERKNVSDADEKMRMEINKWTEKLPLTSGEDNNIRKYSDLLMCLLKASADSRKCLRQPESKNLSVVEETLATLKSDDLGVSNSKHGNTSSAAGPSCGACSGCGASLPQLEFLISKTVHNWCAQLPLQYGVADEYNVVQGMKALIFQRLIRFVKELHFRPNTLHNEELYEHHLNEEIERIFAQLANDRAYWEEQRGKNERKYQLINALKALRPLVQEVRDRELYKEQLKHTISSFHESNISENAQMSILDAFIKYNECKGDFESQELYKLMINDALKHESKNEDVDSLLAANRLICELSKVKTPAHSARQRRYSEPNPVSVNRLPSAPALRRHSLPHNIPPYSQKSCPRCIPPQNVVPPAPPSYPRNYSSPLSSSLPVSRPERPPDFRRSLPLTSRGVPPQLQPELPIFYPSAGLDIRPFPLPPPAFNSTNDSHIYQSPVREQQITCRTPQNQQNLSHRECARPGQSPGPQMLYRRPERQQNLSDRELAERSYRDREQIVDQQTSHDHSRPRIRTAARAQAACSSTECPEERRGNRGTRQSRQEYCETCDRDDDCAYGMPYPPRNYMYF